MPAAYGGLGIVFVVVLIDGFLVWILERLILHKREFGGARAAASATIAVAGSRCSLSVPSALYFDLLCPLPQGFLGGEPYNEIFDAGVTFPENLTCV